MDHRLTALSAPSGALRRFVLGTAFLLALVVASTPRGGIALAQDTAPAATTAPPGTSKPSSPNAPVPPKAPAPPKAVAGTPAVAEPASAAKDAASVAGTRGTSSKIDISTDKNGNKHVTIEKSGAAADADTDATDENSTISAGPAKRGGKKVHVDVDGWDHEYDSWGDFTHTEPGMAFMVVAIVGVVFLSPVLAIALILWYRMRKARMLNETMLRLAEKGVVAPAEAMGALTGSNPAAAAASTAPLYEQARQMRRRATWSDLRKGVILAGVGLGLTLYSMFDDRSPNGLGLVLLFVGIGYLALWWFEERQFAPGATAPGAAPPAGSSGRPNGSA